MSGKDVEAKGIVTILGLFIWLTLVVAHCRGVAEKDETGVDDPQCYCHCTDR